MQGRSQEGAEGDTKGQCDRALRAGVYGADADRVEYGKGPPRKKPAEHGRVSERTGG